MLGTLSKLKEGTVMRSNSYTIANIFPANVRNRLADITSNVIADAQEARNAVCDTLEQKYKFAAKALNKANRKVTRFSRRHPIPTIAASMALGFLIGRSRR
jgi:hypothetical protein